MLIPKKEEVHYIGYTLLSHLGPNDFEVESSTNGEIFFLLLLHLTRDQEF